MVIVDIAMVMAAIAVEKVMATDITATAISKLINDGRESEE